MSDWFENIFGFKEFKDGKNQVYENCIISTNSNGYKTLIVKKNEKYSEGKLFPIGRFITPQLSQLREAGENILSKNTTQQKFKITHEIFQSNQSNSRRSNSRTVNTNIFNIHENGNIIQVDSNFNCLNNPNISKKPQDGITIYKETNPRFQTTGQKCAIACAAGTLYRNYFVPIVNNNGKIQEGQYYEESTKTQLNTLDELELELKNTFFSIKNGFFSSTNIDLTKLNQNINNETQIEQLKKSIKIGVHQDVGVTCLDIDGNCLDITTRPERVTPTTRPERVVTQIFCSNFNVISPQITNYEKLVKLVLEANYEAVLWASIIYAPNKQVYLYIPKNLIQEWCYDAMVKAINLLYEKKANLDIVICHDDSLNIELNIFNINEKICTSLKINCPTSLDKLQFQPRRQSTQQPRGQSGDAVESWKRTIY